MTSRWTVLRSRLTLLLLVSTLLAACAGLTLQSQIDGLMKEGQSLYAEKKYEQATDKFACRVQPGDGVTGRVLDLAAVGDLQAAEREGQAARHLIGLERRFIQDVRPV